MLETDVTVHDSQQLSDSKRIQKNKNGCEGIIQTMIMSQRTLHFSDVTDSGKTLSFDLPKIQTKGL